MDDMYKAGEAALHDDFGVVDVVHVDMRFLKYIEFGKVLASGKITELEYDAAYKTLQSTEFTARYTDDLDVVFKDIPTILEYTKEVRGDIVIRLAPSFNGSIEIINKVLDSSRTGREITGNKNKMRVILDMSSVGTLPDDISRLICREYSTIFKSDVSITYRLGPADVYFLSHIEDFTSHFLTDLDDLKMLDTRVYCRRSLSSAIVKTLTVGLDAAFSGILLLMTAATQFEYVPMPRCLGVD